MPLSDLPPCSEFSLLPITTIKVVPEVPAGLE
jgi:hypothetical protein